MKTAAKETQFARFAPLVKVDEEKREIVALLAEEAPDKSGEIMDYAKSKPHFKAWSESISKATNGKSLGNVRVMHGNKVGGKLTQIAFDDAAKNIPVVVKVVDDAEWKMVQEGCYTGLSIGGSYGEKWADGKLTRYEAKPLEASLVDNPCMYGATFQMVRAGGATEMRKFTPTITIDAALEQLAKIQKATTVEDGAAIGAETVFVMSKDAHAAVEFANQAIAALKSMLAEMATVEGEPNTFDLNTIIEAIQAAVSGKIGAEIAVMDEAVAAVPEAGPEEPAAEAEAAVTTEEATPPAEEDEEPETMAAAAPADALKKIQESLTAQAKAITEAIAQVESKGADGAELQKAVDAVTAKLTGQIEDLTKRLKKVEDQPAESGRPVRPVQKSLGSMPSDGKDANAPIDAFTSVIQKAVADRTINKSQAQALSLDAAAALMRGK